MKFLIQKIGGNVRHDFTFTLLESIRFQNWLRNEEEIKVKFIDTPEIKEPDDIYPPIPFKSFHEKYVPVGSVEFVSEFIEHFYGFTPKPINVPQELFSFADRYIINAGAEYFHHCGKMFIKSNDKIKGVCGIVNQNEPINLPAGNYQYSQIITIDSEWRAFVYNGKLVGLQNYAGEFTKFPNVGVIKEMIKAYKSAPIAYTLDVGVQEFNHNKTFVIEVHDFFSCGLYGFADHAIYPNMLYKWFWQFIQREMVNQYGIENKINRKK